MIRPGQNVNSPAMTSAPTNRPIIRPRRVTHAQLIGVGKTDVRSGLRQFGEQVPRHRGLSDTRRAAEPQHGDQVLSQWSALLPGPGQAGTGGDRG